MTSFLGSSRISKVLRYAEQEEPLLSHAIAFMTDTPHQLCGSLYWPLSTSNYLERGLSYPYLLFMPSASVNQYVYMEKGE